MNSPAKKNRSFSFNFAEKVIELQAKGYHLDYYIGCNRELLCAQNSEAIPSAAVMIDLVGHAYDQLSRRFKYLYTIETCNGEKGVMVADCVFSNLLSA